jgi:hypothetical protein
MVSEDLTLGTLVDITFLTFANRLLSHHPRIGLLYASASIPLSFCNVKAIELKSISPWPWFTLVVKSCFTRLPAGRATF